MSPLQPSQHELLLQLQQEVFLANPTGGFNTHQIGARLHHKQAYDSYLRNRLFRLRDRGLLRCVECVQTNSWGAVRVLERRWYLQRGFGHTQLEQTA